MKNKMSFIHTYIYIAYIKHFVKFYTVAFNKIKLYSIIFIYIFDLRVILRLMKLNLANRL